VLPVLKVRYTAYAMKDPTLLPLNFRSKYNGVSTNLYIYTSNSANQCYYAHLSEKRT